jgi:hypothetical protein
VISVYGDERLDAIARLSADVRRLERERDDLRERLDAERTRADMAEGAVAELMRRMDLMRNEASR